MKKVLLLVPHGAEIYETAAFIDVLGWASIEGNEEIALVTAGLLCPTIVVRTPPKKSRYFDPSTSHTQPPSPRTIEMGSA